MNSSSSINWRVVFAMAALALLYCVWPLDLMPGLPIDDIAVAAVLALIAYKRSNKHELPAQNA